MCLRACCLLLAACPLALLPPGAPLLSSTCILDHRTRLFTVLVPLSNSARCIRRVHRVGAFAAKRAINWSVTYRSISPRYAAAHTNFSSGHIIPAVDPVPPAGCTYKVACLQLLLPLLVCHLLKRPAVSRPAPKDPVRCLSPWHAPSRFRLSCFGEAQGRVTQKYHYCASLTARSTNHPAHLRRALPLIAPAALALSNSS